MNNSIIFNSGNPPTNFLIQLLKLLPDGVNMKIEIENYNEEMRKALDRVRFYNLTLPEMFKEHFKK